MTPASPFDFVNDFTEALLQNQALELKAVEVTQPGANRIQIHCVLNSGRVFQYCYGWDYEVFPALADAIGQIYRQSATQVKGQLIDMLDRAFFGQVIH